MREPPRMDPQSAPCSKRAILGELSENVVVAVTSTVINEKNCQSISTLIHDESNPIDTEHLLQQLTVIRAKDVEKDKRIAELEREVGQCRKRERAIRDVFLDLYSGTKEKNKEEDRLKGRATKLKAKYKELRRDQKDLENDQLKFEENKLHFKAKLAPRNAGEESFSVYNYKYGSAQMKLLGEVNPWSAGKIGRHFVMGEPLDIWKGEREEFYKIEKLLRKHDYYAGWLDAMRSIDHQKAMAMQVQNTKIPTLRLINDNKIVHLLDSDHPQHPMNAGLNAGLLFAWSALCDLHDLPQHDVRLDDRVWRLKDLAPITREDHFGDYHFWKGVDIATEKM